MKVSSLTLAEIEFIHGTQECFSMLYFTCKLISQCINYFQEAMRQVPDCEDEPVPDVPPVSPKKKKRRPPVQVKPLPPAGKGILISPGFRWVKVQTQNVSEK
jgi:hypothetical protein